MKNILLLLGMMLLFKVHAADTTEKIYTQEEFNKKLYEEVTKKIGKLKKQSIAQLTKELLEKEQLVDERNARVDQRLEQLKIGESSLVKKIISLERKQKKIIGCVDDNKKSQARRVKQMVSVISNMKPVKAAELLSVQDSLISVKILELIDPKRASKIFNLMDKEVSARLQKQYLNMQQ